MSHEISLANRLASIMMAGASKLLIFPSSLMKGFFGGKCENSAASTEYLMVC